MSKERNLVSLEKEIIAKMLSIKNGKTTIASSGIGKLINAMKPLDEALHAKLMTRYKDLIEEIKK